MVLQACIDDSYDPGDGAFVLAGFVASAERWASFEREWEKSLPKWGRLSPNGSYHFHMVEMAAAGQMEKVAGLYRIIEDHVQLGLSCGFLKGDLERAKARIRIPDRRIEWDIFEKPYMCCYRTLMDMFHWNRIGKMESIFPLTEKIDFYFDEQREKRQVIDAWEEYIRQRPEETKALYGNQPIFRHDCDFLPLQAADFYSWWVRKWIKEGVADARLADLAFGEWKADPYKFPRAHIMIDEETLVADFIRLFREQDPEITVIDLKNFAI